MSDFTQNMRNASQEKDLIESLVSRTHFKKPEIEALIKHYKRLVTCASYTSTNRRGLMDRTIFRDFLLQQFQMTDDIFMDRVFRAFDTDNNSYVSEEEWVTGMSVFLRGTVQERVKFCFTVYDLNQDGYISREEMFHVLKNSLLKQASDEDPDEGIKELVDIALKALDQDHDNRISFLDFENSNKKDKYTLVMELLGPCLPQDCLRDAYEATYCAPANKQPFA
ncbi:DgyrCDS1284 [Dimorphilus gyrociliatus]|uniref:DgyrCDS1284 n=1 Tax=Dimorphilus gyrociliatus TaxID=2664684 RepID=A0A7I8V8N5_9ANNE|nr:DgyrCDS1284 [Dimorphilus gyrociliatus]